MKTIIAFAVDRRWLVLTLVSLVAALGVYNALKLPIDAVPDITNIQVQINTEAEGYSPLESEQRVTFAVENAMAGLPRLDYTRSLSRYGLSQVTVIFEEGTDIYWARQQVTERLQTIRSQLPNGLEPTLGPIASGLGEIFTYAVKAQPDARTANGLPYSLEDLRTVQDWIIRPQLVKVPGVTEINSVGGFAREYQVAPDPGKLLAFKLTLADVVRTLENNNRNSGAGYIERNGEQWLIRSPGQVASLEEIEQLVVAKRDDAPVRIRDIAKVRYGRELRTGAATLNGEETVLGTAFMLLGENSRTVSSLVAEKLVAINASLPRGVVAEPLYDRTTLVDKTIRTVQTNLFEGAVLVIAVLFALLGNLRAAFIAALVIPLSMLFALTGMAAGRVSGNLMSLGAIDFGLIVDGAVIVVENTLRRLAIAQQQKQRLLTLVERLESVKLASAEVFKPAVFGVLVIMLVYLPIFALSGVEGKMFHPMAFTVVAALVGALVFSVTFVPALLAILLRDVSEKENRLMLAARRCYQPLLQTSLQHPVLMVSGALLIVAISGITASRLGSEFLPQLDEHDVALHALRIPGTGLQQSVQMQRQLEASIAELAEVRQVFAKIGTPEIATDPMPPNVADTFVMLKPREQWPDPNKSKAQLLNELRGTVLAVPGNKYEVTQPIEMRFNELIAGVRSDVALRIYGDDLDSLATAGKRARELLAKVAGARDVRMEQAKGLPMMSVEPERDHLALLGLSIADVQQALRAAVSGVDTGLIYEGDRRFRLVVRMDESQRRDPEALARLPIALPSGSNPDLNYVPLGEVATIRLAEGPNQINRRDGKRYTVVTANVQGRDLGSFIAETQTLMQTQLVLPAGYWLEYGGTFEQLQSASARLQIVVPLTLLLILGLLYSSFGSLRDSLVIFTGVPLALSGGVIALLVRDMPLSISAAVGFIALSGVAVLNGVVMLSFIRQLRDRGMPLLEAIGDGASQRLRPVLMTALVASLGFIPMALNTGTGAEVQRPLATVVIGGIVSSTLLTLVVLPALYQLVYRLGGRRAISMDSAPAAPM
ncbi:CusA/CzcA family heavy metal efflux RND transporter [Pseudomaricurvus alkylphenolicus]|uniref:efflux RND transporter permease subunit n=1 Tax=Pseudomaricurvus alkylphenolicus TaxID=1306991 RepID=UPI0014241E7E|nr:CusA/CzcA family heavy metal efflux RND transporter [Pseudomaricurvus alkylphenolicus]NIB39212.1 CusA/CzcA family heavy metal efflux RND transporter [Pseudomaricurvus alkylphenolicus]